MKKNRCKTTGKQRSLANLKPRWKPGESGNYKGRPRKEQAFADITREMLSSKEIDIMLTRPDGRTSAIKIKSSESMRHAIIAALIREGIGGNVQAARELIDRTDGKATDKLSLVDDYPHKVIFQVVEADGTVREDGKRTITRPITGARQDRAQLPAGGPVTGDPASNPTLRRSAIVGHPEGIVA